MVSPTAGALQSVDEFLTQVAFGPGQEFPFWASVSGRWALANRSRKRQEVIEDLPPEGYVLRWRVGDVVAHIHIKPLPDKPGLWCETGPKEG